MANEEKKVRVTKSQRISDIMALLKGEAVAYNTTVADAIAFLEHEQDLLEKKNSSGTKKQTETQKKNEEYKELMLEHLATLTPEHKGLTCTELGKQIPALNEFNNQKISALVRQLEEAGKVVRSTDKGKTLFALKR